jgi:hypothetical protein
MAICVGHAVRAEPSCRPDGTHGVLYCSPLTTHFGQGLLLSDETGTRRSGFLFDILPIGLA